MKKVGLRILNGEEIKDRLEEFGVRQSELARMIGYNYGYLNRAINGTEGCSERLMELIETELGMAVKRGTRT